MIGALLLSALWSSSAVQAQSTNVVCASNFTYLYNQQGQNPCLVAAYLEAPCSTLGTNFTVSALDVNQTYTGPTEISANFCSCSTVVYSLTSACAQCQGRKWVSWSFWRGGCRGDSMVTMEGYPLDIPPQTGIPAWAYQDISESDMWNDTLALPQATAAPESTYYGTPTASVIYRSGTPVIATGTAAAGADTSIPSKNLAGPIAGGVVGGIALIAIIGFFVWRHIKGRQTEDPIPMPTAYYPPGHEQLEKGNWPPGTPKPDGGDYPSIVDYGVSYPTPAPTLFSDRTKVMATPKLYDPNDPSTFPKTPASFAYQSTTNYSQTTLANQNDHTSPVGRYTGHPEF